MMKVINFCQELFTVTPITCPPQIVVSKQLKFKKIFVCNNVCKIPPIILTSVALQT